MNKLTSTDMYNEAKIWIPISKEDSFKEEI
jgi:hypothetical protein